MASGLVIIIIGEMNSLMVDRDDVVIRGNKKASKFKPGGNYNKKITKFMSYSLKDGQIKQIQMQERV
mgnify:FL=1